MFTLHNSISGTQIGKPLADLTRAQQAAIERSRSVGFTAEIREGLTVVAYGYRGEISPAENRKATRAARTECMATVDRNQRKPARKAQNGVR